MEHSRLRLAIYIPPILILFIRVDLNELYNTEDAFNVKLMHFPYKKIILYTKTLHTCINVYFWQKKITFILQ